MHNLIRNCAVPLVLDADALNIIARSKYLLEYVPAGSVFTPHPGELQRLTGTAADREDLILKAKDLATENGITVVGFLIVLLIL